MKRVVGLVVLTHSKANGLKVILQRRGAREILPGSCKISAQGEIEKGEDPVSAVARISKDELGDELTLKWQLNSSLERVFYFLEKNRKNEITVYGAQVPEETLKLIRVKGTSGGIEHTDGKEFFLYDGVLQIMDNNNIFPKKIYFSPYEVIMKSDEVKFVQDVIMKLGSKCF
ncbi:MAG: NUDIX hydrolase [Minisyncoccia bacterium]